MLWEQPTDGDAVRLDRRDPQRRGLAIAARGAKFNPATCRDIGCPTDNGCAEINTFYSDSADRWYGSGGAVAGLNRGHQLLEIPGITQTPGPVEQAAQGSLVSSLSIGTG